MPDAHEAAFNTALGLLTRRNHTRHELFRKLMQRRIDEDIIRQVISKCERLGYINEKETARLLFRELKRKGHGPHRISSDMRRKGLEDALIQAMVSGYAEGEDELSNARRAVEKKIMQFKREQDRRKRKEKMYRFLRSRGFSSPVISQVLTEAMEWK